MERAVFVADDELVGPLGSGVDEEAQAGGFFGDVEFQLRGVGVGGLQRCQERGACCGYGSVLVAGAVNQSDFAGRGSERRIWGAWETWWFRRSGGAGDDEMSVGLRLGVDDCGRK